MTGAHPSVLIVGGGPVGLTLANLLGAAGVRTLIVEANPSTSATPKAILIDDVSFRIFQAIGLADTIRVAVVYGTGARYSGSGGRLLATVPPSIGDQGFARRSAFNQPELEAILRAGLSRYGCVTSRFSCRLAGLESLPDGERAVLVEASGRSVVDAQWVVGCDGGRSAVRDFAGIDMVGESFAESWLIVDTADDPDDSRYTKFICDPARPTVSVPAPRRGRRYEFLLLPGEQPEAMLTPASVAALTAPHRRLEPPEIVRQAVYTFHALTAQRFRAGRRLLAGDACHMMPPFAGQGMNTGVRDAANLAWKLALSVEGTAGPELLDTYESERRPDVEAMIRLSVRLGRIVMPLSRWRARVRDVVFHLLSLAPSLKRWVATMRWKPAPRCGAGCVVDAGRGVIGTLLPQPRVSTGDGSAALLDEALGPGFVLLADDAGRLANLSDPLWSRLGVRRVTVLTGDRTPRDGQSVGDRDDVLGRFLRRHRGEVLLVRPDRFVAGAFRPEDEHHFAASFGRCLGAERASSPIRQAA